VSHKPMLVASQMATRVTLVASAHAAEVTRPTSSHARVANWAVQVGTYSTETAAHQAALAARREAEAGEIRVEPIRLRGKTTWRAQVMGLTQSDAQDTCSSLHKHTCMTIRPDSRQVASR
jgi:D-alanyl-D-alanine carboxypeptidase